MVLSSGFPANGPNWQELKAWSLEPSMHPPSYVGVYVKAPTWETEEFPTLKDTLLVKDGGNRWDNITVFDELGIKTWAGFCFSVEGKFSGAVKPEKTHISIYAIVWITPFILSRRWKNVGWHLGATMVCVLFSFALLTTSALTLNSSLGRRVPEWNLLLPQGRVTIRSV